MLQQDAVLLADSAQTPSEHVLVLVYFRATRTNRSLCPAMVHEPLPWFQYRCYNRHSFPRRTSIHEYCNICCLLKCHHISLYHTNTFCFVLQFPNHMSSNILLTIRPIHLKYQFILQSKFLTNLIPSDIVKSAFKVPVAAFSGMKPWIRIASCVNERYEFNRGFV